MEELDKALERASSVGVVAVVTMGSDAESSQQAIELSKRYADKPRVFAAVGVHPWEVFGLDLRQELKRVEALCQHAVAVGEVGLDYWLKATRKSEEGRRIQMKAFLGCLELAKRFDKPVVVHSRGAWEDCFDALQQVGIKKAVFHWFSGPYEVLKKILDAGYFVSATPALAYSKEHIRAITNTPLDRVLAETDSPVVYQGRVSQPADVAITVSELAKVKGVSVEEAAEATFRNAIEFYELRGLLAG